MDIVYPIMWCQAPLLFGENANCKFAHTHHLINSKNELLNALKNKSKFIGIHWYNGCNIAKDFINENNMNDIIKDLLDLSIIN